MGVDLTVPNVEQRTPLHVACCLGNVEVVEYLLLHGASVHMKDRYDRTPLMDAINNDNHEVIKMLVKCGAHIVGPPQSIGDEMCSAAAQGMVTRLKSFQLADVDLSQIDRDGRSPLHMGALHNREEVVRFLLDAGVQTDQTDLLGDTPMSIAVKRNFSNIQKMLKEAS